ncbi:MAG: hypothetical protein B6D58_04935 [candidate division Zixibacteria bacterium 4484_95]|nr:MAG: hypothetical protein B6D58_04935 [candidate division Zixibacteria bacterium 4484_95]RKX19419.1 MAG: DUF1858 domain-containing protein [candidate division Zixibacteria bacterium]
MIKPSDSVEMLLEKYPGINSFLMKRGIHCIQCGEPVWKTLEELVNEKGLDIKKIVSELNRHYRHYGDQQN